jgi:hypothetical protein
MRMRTVALVLFVLTLAACGWTQPGFDAGHDQTNPLETALTPANVGGLVQHTLTIGGHPITSYFVVGAWLIVNTDAGATAYDRHTCPRSDDGPCTPVWTRPGEQLRSSDGTTTMFFTTGASTFDAVDLSGHREWSGVPLADPSYDGSPARFGGDAFTIGGGHLFVTLDTYAGHGTASSTLNVFALGGCGAPSCAPLSHYRLTGYPVPSFLPRFSVTGDRVIGQSGLTTSARDAMTGTPLWTVNGYSFPLLVHGRDAYSGTASPTSFQVFDAEGNRNCGGTPRYCTPLRTLTTDALFAVSDALAVGQARPTPGSVALALFSTDDRGCGGGPVTCVPIATTSPLGSGVTDAVLTSRLVLTTAVDGQGSHLAIFDAGLQSGCTGAPKTCSPLADLPVSASTAGSIEVWDGHVYTLTADGILHAFALPPALG